jgi:hypothetical protein
MLTTLVVTAGTYLHPIGRRPRAIIAPATNYSANHINRSTSNIQSPSSRDRQLTLTTHLPLQPLTTTNYSADHTNRYTSYIHRAILQQPTTQPEIRDKVTSNHICEQISRTAAG